MNEEKEIVKQIDLTIGQDDIKLARMQINYNSYRMSIDIFGEKAGNLNQRKELIRNACNLILDELDKVNKTINFFEINNKN